MTLRRWICKACNNSPIENKPCTFERDTNKSFRYAVCPFYCDTLPIWEEERQEQGLGEFLGAV